MEQLTWEGLLKGLVILAAFAVALLAIGGAINMIRGWRKPKTDAEAETQKKLDCDKRRLDSHEEQICENRKMDRALCKALNALLMHAITGNNIANLRAAKNELDEYLIAPGEK